MARVRVVWEDTNLPFCATTRAPRRFGEFQTGLWRAKWWAFWFCFFHPRAEVQVYAIPTGRKLKEV